MREVGDLPPAPEPEPEPEPAAEAAEAEPVATPEPAIQQDIAPAPEPSPAPVQAAPQPAPAPVQPQLVPLQLPTGELAWVTPEQAAYFASMGVMAARQQTPTQQPQPEPQPQATHPASFDSEKARNLVKALNYGDEETALRAIQDFTQAVAPAGPDPAAIRQQAVQEALAQIRLETNLQAVGGEYPQIFADRVLSHTAALELQQIRSDPRSAQFDDLTLMREACRRVTARFNPPASASQPVAAVSTQPASQAAPAVSARLERKRAAPSAPTVADRRLGADDDAPAVPTNRDVVNQIRKARGQSPLP